jgi:hypothetical protein
MDIKGNLISKEWYDDIEPFNGNFAIVTKYTRMKKEYSIIDKSGNLIMPNHWFSCVFFPQKEFSKYVMVAQYNYVDGFDDYGNRIERQVSAWNVINEDGKFLSKEWFAHIDKDSNEDIFYVETFDSKQNVMDNNGNLLFDEGVEKVTKFNETPGNFT